MNIGQERAEFEVWRRKHYDYDDLNAFEIEFAFAAFQAGRAARQSQSNHDTTLFCDLKTDEEKSAFFLSGRGYETGVIALSIQNDVAMAYHRCAEYKKELETLQSQDREDALEAESLKLREALEMMVEMVEMNGFGRDYAMDVARAALAARENKS